MDLVAMDVVMVSCLVAFQSGIGQIDGGNIDHRLQAMMDMCSLLVLEVGDLRMPDTRSLVSWEGFLCYTFNGGIF